MKRLLRAAIAACAMLTMPVQAAEAPKAPVREIAPGPFRPDWESLKQYECPQWFRDAKFGIWAHWDAQCQPEEGSWYAREMYLQGSGEYNYHVKHYGHPSKFGFKDIDRAWKAEHWDPEKLIRLYKRAGAKYFVALASHCDNFDCFDSKYQPWNSLNIGPRKDIVGTWAKIARRNGLRFGVSVHSNLTWDWLDVAHGSDKTGPLAGVPYDGVLTKADGKGQWWQGYDPADLYPPAAAARTPAALAAYITRFFNRTKDLVDKYDPDLLYFDSVGPPWSEAGMNIFAHYYNASLRRRGKLDVVLNLKGMPHELLKTLVHDLERGRSNKIEPYPWQTDTCIGDWHYMRWRLAGHAYKTPQTVVRMLVDVVSKNGNMLLSIPLKGDGTIDGDEVKFLQGLTAWMDVNGECIFGTRPWRIAGEGPVRIKAGEGGEDRLTGRDFRFTTKGDAIYAIALDWPGRQAVVKSLAKGSRLVTGDVAAVRLLGCERDLEFSRTPEGLVVKMPQTPPCQHAFALKITGLKTVPGPYLE